MMGRPCHRWRSEKSWFAMSGFRKRGPLIYSEAMDRIRVLYHREPGGWWAESPDFPGWTAGGSSYEEVRKAAEEGIAWALERSDLELQHFVAASVVEEQSAAAGGI